MRKKIVLFFSSVKSKDSFKTVQFYNIDINILKDLGCDVVLSNRVSDAICFWKYDFVYVYFYRYGFFVALIARLFGKKAVFTGGIDSLNQKNRGTKDYRIQKLFFRLCYRVCNISIIVSKTDLENVRAVISNTRKIAYSEHTIDVNRYNASEGLKQKIFVTIGWTALSSIERKGIDKSITVFAELVKHPEFSDYTFVLVGTPGDGIGYLKQLIKDLHVSDKIVIKGNVSEDEKIHLLERAKYYFQLSLFEGFGLAALEAVCAKDILIHSGKGGLSNPIYKDEVLFDIDKDLISETESLYHRLIDFDTSIIEDTYQKVCESYGNERRKKELGEILSRIFH